MVRGDRRERRDREERDSTRSIQSNFALPSRFVPPAPVVPLAPLVFLLFTLLLPGCSSRQKPESHWCCATDAARVLRSQKPRAHGDQLVFRQTPKNGGNHIVLFTGSRRAEINGTLVWLNSAPFGRPGSRHWRMSRNDLTNTLHAICMPRPAPQNKLVMLDPGHGGNDPGAATADGALLEKNITLDLALRVKSILESRGIPAALTRETDATLSPSDRALLASFQPAGLFVSIHLNHAANTLANGVETFILPAAGHPSTAAAERPRGVLPTDDERASEAWRPGNAFDPENARLGYALQSRLAPPASDRGLKRNRFRVLSNAPCPAVLVECGFLSNPEEAALLQTSAHREKTALALADAITSFLQ